MKHPDHTGFDNVAGNYAVDTELAAIHLLLADINFLT